MAISVGIVFALGVVYMLFVRLFSGIIVWLCILAYFVVIIILGIFLYLKAKDIKTWITTNGYEKDPYTD